MALYFDRDTDVYLIVPEATSGVTTYQIPVLAGFAAGQTTNTSEITLSEAVGSSGDSRRGRALFNDSLEPVEVTFSTYVRPFVSNGTDLTASDVYSVELALWAMLAGAEDVEMGSNEGEFYRGASQVTTASTTTHIVDFDYSNVASFTGTTLIIGGVGDTGANPQYYQINDFVVDEATIDFDVEGIATIQWSGKGSRMVITDTIGSVDVDEDITATDNFIQNRLSTMTLTSYDDSGVNRASFRGSRASSANNGVYTITITGGSITVSNNISYLTPETLGSVNQPIANISGTRSVSGNVTCYIETANDTSTGTTVTATSGNLLQDSLTNTPGGQNALSLTRNRFDLDINIGGTSGNALLFDIPRAHLEIPQTSFDEVFSVDIPFHAMASDFDTPNELTVTYSVT